MTHWDGVHARPEAAASWFEADAASSLRVLDGAGVTPDRSVVDVGAGTGRLVDALLARGHRDVTALDVSEVALATARTRLGPAAARVDWVVADVLAWAPPRHFDVWHDRAVFHFLVDPSARDRYRMVLDAALAADGVAVIGTFAADGPTQCSGLPTTRWTPAALAAEIGGPIGLAQTDGCRAEHRTPAGAVQPFTWVVLSRGAKRAE